MGNVQAFISKTVYQCVQFPILWTEWAFNQQSYAIISQINWSEIRPCAGFIPNLHFFCLCVPSGNQVQIHGVKTMMLELSGAMNYVKLQGHNFHFNFSSTSPDKVWMWHEMRYGSRANWYLINARPDWRAQAHLLHVSSNMHDLQAGFLPQQTFHAIRHTNVKWCTQPTHRGSKYSAERLYKSWQMLCEPLQRAAYFMY